MEIVLLGTFENYFTIGRHYKLTIKFIENDFMIDIINYFTIVSTGNYFTVGINWTLFLLYKFIGNYFIMEIHRKLFYYRSF